MSRNLNPIAYGEYKITANPGDLFSFADTATQSDTPTSIPTGARSFKGRLESNDIRVRLDKTNPQTSSNGELVSAGDDILLDETLMRWGRMRTITGTARIHGHFYNVEATVFFGGG